MRRSRLLFELVLCTLCLVGLLGLALMVASCDSSQTDTTGTTASTTAEATDTTVAAGSQGRISAANILFRDDFQDGDSEGWRVTGAWVVQQDGDIYTFDTSGTGFAPVPKGVSWEGDYAFKASYLLTAGTLAFSFDTTTGGRYYVPIDGQLISLVKEDASGNKTVLTQAQAPEIGKQHYIAMAKQRGTIQVYVDKSLWLATTDASPLAVGTVAVGSTEGTIASVDNVMVNKIVRTLSQGTPTVAAVAPAQVVQPSDDGADLAALPDSADGVPALTDTNDPEDLPLPTVQFAGWTGGNQGSGSFTVSAGSEVMLSWAVTDAQDVFLDDLAVEPQGTRALTPTESTVYTLTVTDLGGEQHDYTVAVTVESDGGPGDEAANHGPDLSVSVTAEYQKGTSAQLGVRISNLGDQNVSGAVFHWYANEQNGEVSKTLTVNVAAGETSSVSFIYDYQAHGTMHWKATVDEDHNLPDTNDSNNSTSGTVTIP